MRVNESDLEEWHPVMRIPGKNKSRGMMCCAKLGCRDMDKQGCINFVHTRSSSLLHVHLTISGRGTFWIWVIADTHI
jgi:hypothetical protein